MNFQDLPKGFSNNSLEIVSRSLEKIRKPNLMNADTLNWSLHKLSTTNSYRDHFFYKKTNDNLEKLKKIVKIDEEIQDICVYFFYNIIIIK